MGLPAYQDARIRHETRRILVDHRPMAESRFGPNSKEVERFLDRLGRLERKQWQAIQEAAPEAGAVPEHDVTAAPEYFSALSRAARLAKSGVFRGPESAFYDAMRVTHHQAETLVAGLGGPSRPAGRSRTGRYWSRGPDAVCSWRCRSRAAPGWSIPGRARRRSRRSRFRRCLRSGHRRRSPRTSPAIRCPKR